MSNIALEVRDLVKSFSLDGATINAVDNVSFQVKSGEFVALVGPSGSGKTTLLSILAALLTPTSGQVLIDGQDLAQMNEKKRVKLRREKIGFTFQSNNLIPFLTAQENVEFMLRLNGALGRAGKIRSGELLARLGLAERLHNLPAQMSGGQQQRVAIARALIHQPAVVLADEPTASLDTERAFQVVETFAHLIHENERAGIMVTHDLRMCQYVDRVLQMQDGKLVREYSAKEEIMELALGTMKH
ncbi:MAG: ABC transporter ATP-binding protein [Anaerolineales bacterium]|jgi:putative ABC transport system ATP-binding protein|uniref:ABC transporter ATP-binding protein n=1 Tax=Candidatus Villigracilis affinis TaxID=3140682 RepID=UPI001E0E7497|nr:ABC transporter ATP-binding protein [Anaerolineales bacterium]MBK9604483.1 ABC transporter ATP-binding protein [Anaerolineales bacterium]MBL0343692.1 ABC transporter ATP-binding protein [Anaerolineales bacterium]